MRYYYAQIDKNNICIAVSDLSGPITSGNMIQLETYDTGLLGKKYNGGIWEDITQPEPEPTQLDRIEKRLETSYNEARETAIDEYTEELLEGGIL